MEFFELGDDEEYDKICGEIFLTTKGNITINCTLCKVVYTNFDSYTKHLYESHSPSIICSEDSLDVESSIYDSEDDANTAEERDISVKIEEANAHDENVLSQDDEELKVLVGDTLMEEETPIQILQNAAQQVEHKPKENAVIPKAQKTTRTRQDVSNKEIISPKDVRHVKKRIIIGPLAIPEEERVFKCPLCYRGFKDRSNMKAHIKRHSLENMKYECPECKKRFYQPSEVKSHMKFHKSDRNFLCSFCGKSFKTNYKLTSHIKRHNNQRDYKCENCGKEFFSYPSLKEHMVVHSDERPFVCKVCSVAFARPLSLQDHMKLHENKRAYKCRICSAGFNQRAGLFNHMKISHKT